VGLRLRFNSTWIFMVIFIAWLAIRAGADRSGGDEVRGIERAIEHWKQ
jgi:hypothetical protein